MAESRIISMSQMIDLAIGSPEMGVVDFNMLQALLHCIVHELKADNKSVEYRGGGMTPPQSPPHQTVHVTEFVVDPKAGTMKEVQQAPVQDGHILVAQKWKEDDRGTPVAFGAPGGAYPPQAPGAPGGAYPPQAPGAPGGAYPPQAPGAPGGAYPPQAPGAPGGAYPPQAPGAPGGAYPPQAPGAPGGAYPPQAPGAPGGAYPPQAPGAPGGAYPPQAGYPPAPPPPPPPPPIPGGKFQMSQTQTKTLTTTSGTQLPIVTLSKFNVLADAVDDLRQKVYGAMPTNEAILEGLRNATNERGVTDMWSTLNVQGRLDAAENGIAKLSSLVEDLISETPELQRHVSKIERAKAIATDATTPRSIAQATQAGVQYFPGMPGTPGAPGMAYPPGTPGAPVMAYPPGTPGAPVMAYPPGTPGAPGQPGAPAMAYPPGTPGAPGMAYPPGTPGAPAMAYPPGTPGAPAMAYAPGTPGAPAMAYAPGTPGAPAMAYPPGAPGQPGAPGMAYPPSTPGTPGMALPPGTPGAPVMAYPPGTPGAPAMAYPPGTPGAPAMAYPPGMPGAPAMAYPPSMPGAPGMAYPPVMAGAPGEAYPSMGMPYPPAQPAVPSTPATMTKFAAFAPTTSDGGFSNMDNGDLKAIAQNVKDLRVDLDNLYVTFYRTMEDVGIDPPETGYTPTPALASAMVKAANKLDEEISQQYAQQQAPRMAVVEETGRPPMAGLAGQQDFGPAAAVVGAGYGGAAPKQRGGFKGGTGFDPSDVYARIFELDKNMKRCCENIERSGSSWQDKIDRLEDQVDYVLKQMGINTNEIKSTRMGTDVANDLQSLMQLFQTVQGMQEQLRQVHDTAMQLAAEKEQRQHHINSLLEQIELLKVIKLDREDMAEAMAEKADIRMLARKVSHDQFEMACDDLAKGLEHAIGKLNLQEALWQQALDDIQREIETKLDKMELSPVKEFFNNKLKMLQENLKQLSQLRREVEAAGTKRRLLRDVNCISCDANAVMQMEAGPSLPGNKPITAMHSMKPYLTYELDTIRKTQASHLPQRNMHDWENIDRQMGQQKPLQKVRSETDKHVCNRYCGGSHTVTTPAQRVARLGHFVKQWGPDVLPLSSGLAPGEDGKMYKVINAENANVGPGGAVEPCTPKPQKRPSSDGRPSKPIIISNECRCLEASGDRHVRESGETKDTKK